MGMTICHLFNLNGVLGLYRVRAYRDDVNMSEPLAIIEGEMNGCSDVLVRVHDQCFTSEVLGSLKCDCRQQLDWALQYIKEQGHGLVIYLQQEGRGMGLANKLKAYSLQEVRLRLSQHHLHHLLRRLMISVSSSSSLSWPHHIIERL